MEIHVNELNSQVKMSDSHALEPAAIREIVRLCVKQVKEELARDQRLAQDRNFDPDRAET